MLFSGSHIALPVNFLLSPLSLQIFVLSAGISTLEITKVCRDQVGRTDRGKHSRVVFCTEVANQQWFMCRCTGMVKEPQIVFPQFRPLPSHIFSEMFNHFQIVPLVNRLSLWQKFMMDNPFFGQPSKKSQRTHNTVILKAAQRGN